MKRLMIGSLLGVTMLVATPAIFPILTQRSYAQTSQTQAAQLQQLIDLGLQQTQQRQPLQAIETLKQALAIAQSIPSREGEAFVNLGLGLNYNRSGQPQAALNFYHQAVRYFQEVNERILEAATLNSIGGVYRQIGQPQEALTYFQQALSITREVSDRATEATTLHNIGAVYGDIGKPQEALTYLQQALPIRREVSDRAREAATLYNIGLVYRDIGEPQKAIDNLEKALKITLEIRAGLAQENRQQFLQNNRAISVALVDLLIDENRPDQAFKWHHLATTFDLADYSHLIDAQVINPPAQKLIDQWNENHERLKLLYAEVDNNWTPELSQQINELQAGNSQIAEDIARQYPEVAELFETTPQDLENLRENIAPGTLVIQPILLTNISEVPDAIALFMVSRDQKAIVKKTPINPSEFDGILTEYRAQLENHNSENFDRNQELLYDYLIRPIEADIAAHSPEKLAIIATGKLRYIPFKTLYDNQRNQHLIEKYPIHYLTRISARRQVRSNTTSSPRVLAFGNPQPSAFDTPGAEQEARQVTEIFSGEYWVREEATRDRFQNDSPRFNILHLANPICFQANGCPGLGLGANQILFAHGETFNIADIGLLGLNQTNLVVLSGGFPTGMETESEGGGLVAIAYLFERAGADAVIASLWNAEDNTTLLIMTEFYENVKQGMTKAEALRQAKLTFAQEGIHPFYWSPLILIGDGGSF
ncbi:CHAT domain-containing protein [Limnospira fusiformis KN01]|uniref:CHAT domain-containing protein n=1 Tax=Limnospira TaxID=2596745 RepID=UPI001658838C|nr:MULTISPECIES: CHAT domain-containing tetratricopeptide repeat protein [Limnospira]MDT9197874.1 CHAT domain-containing protein [Limnospira sp. PMC 1042.18]ULB44514.1 CHAT domain-containing protein [Limnospira fusiformis KN01]